MYYLQYLALIQIFWSACAVSQPACGDNTWVAFSDTKCIKVIDNFVTRDDANTICSEEVGSNYASLPPLLTIKSKEEQLFAVNYIFNITGILDDVWLGARRQNNNLFRWDDGSNVNYSNWGVGSPSNDSQKGCVQLISPLSMKTSSQAAQNGLWGDVVCGRRNVIVCQKIQKWRIDQLQNAILQLRKELLHANKEIIRTADNLRDTQAELNRTKSNLESTQTFVQILQRNPVPIGFIYVQLYNQPNPSALWPGLSWSEISSTYAGRFFRVFGGNSAAFGTVQNGDAPRLSRVQTDRCSTELYPDWLDVTIPLSGTSNPLASGGDNAPYVCNTFTSTGGEVRPTNEAVKLWKRTL